VRPSLWPLLLILGACAAGPDPAPPDARAIVLANKNKLWKDPDSIKNASIAAPQRHLGFMWHVCVRLNVKNSFGGYTGERDSIIGIYDSASPPEILIEGAASFCDPLPHVPFPELEPGRDLPQRPKRG